MTELSMSLAASDVALQQLFAGLEALLVGEETVVDPFRSALPRRPFRAQAATGQEALPIGRFWPTCLEAALAVGGDLGAVATILRDLTPILRWRQNPNYRQAPPTGDFLDNYGYAEICGSYGLIAADIRFGVLILGPDTCYPSHRHPAEEIYIPLGLGAWQRGEADVAADRWTEQPAGTLIHHPPFVPHATRAGDRPLAALYLWRGDLATEAKLDSKSG